MSDSTVKPAVKARLALGRRDQTQAEQLAARLSDLGFQVEQVAPRGVSFAGDTDLFERVFHSQVIVSEDGYALAEVPELPPALAEAESVYLPTRPEFFPKESE